MRDADSEAERHGTPVALVSGMKTDKDMHPLMFVAGMVWVLSMNGLWDVLEHIWRFIR